MRLTCRLVAALDGRNIGPEEPQRLSIHIDGHWYVLESGQHYSNTYLVTDTDAEGQSWLEAHQQQEADTRRS